MASSLEEARAELDKEFGQFRERLGEVLVAVAAVEQAGPTDDVHGLLETLLDKVKEARTGGLIGSGAKGHRAARQRWLEAGGG